MWMDESEYVLCVGNAESDYELCVDNAKWLSNVRAVCGRCE